MIKITPSSNLAQLLSSEAFSLLGDAGEAIKQVVRDTYDQAYQYAVDQASSRLYRTKQQYLDALQRQKVSPYMYVITLDESAHHLEEGYGPFDMKQGLLKTNLNAEGLGEYNKGRGRGGIKTSKKGYRYRAIPFEQNRAVASPNHPLNNTPVGKGADADTMGGMAQSLKNMFSKAGHSGISKDANGNPILGKVGSITGSGNQATFRGQGMSQSFNLGTSLGGSPNQFPAMLNNVTKYQTMVKGKVRSSYVVYRMVSNDPKYAGKFIHPGFEGIHLFPDIEKFAADTLEAKLKEIFGD